MTKGRKEKISMKPVARVVQVSTSQQGRGSDSSDSDDSFFDEDGRKDGRDDDSVFDDEKDGEGGGDGDEKNADGGGGGKDAKDGEPGGKSARMLTMDEIRRIRSSLKTVDHIWMYGEDIEFGSDSDISDASEIWSEYGDEIVVDKQPKNLRWDPADKKVSQRLSLKEKGIKKTTTKKKKKAKKVTKKPSKAAAASEATTPELEGLSYVSTGPGQGSGGGVYYVDFSDEYKTCLKRSRDEIEKETHLSMLEKREAKWADEISKDRNLPIEDRLLQLKLDTSSPVRRQPIKSTGSTSLAPPMSRPGSGTPSSKQDISGGESEGGDQTASQGDDASRRESIKQNVKRRMSSSSKRSQKSGGVDTTHDAMGSKWPKAMWDNTENYWRMIMATETFVVTPANYTRQLEVDYRNQKETVTFAQLEKARNKCSRWLAANRDHFATVQKI